MLPRSHLRYILFVHGEVLFIVRKHQNILTETINHHIRQMIGEPHFYLFYLAGEHREHTQRPLGQFEFFERFLLSFCDVIVSRYQSNKTA